MCCFFVRKTVGPPAVFLSSHIALSTKVTIALQMQQGVASNPRPASMDMGGNIPVSKQNHKYQFSPIHARSTSYDDNGVS